MNEHSGGGWWQWFHNNVNAFNTSELYLSTVLHIELKNGKMTHSTLYVFYRNFKNWKKRKVGKVYHIFEVYEGGDSPKLESSSGGQAPSDTGFPH